MSCAPIHHCCYLKEKNISRIKYYIYIFEMTDTVFDLRNKVMTRKLLSLVTNKNLIYKLLLTAQKKKNDYPFT